MGPNHILVYQWVVNPQYISIEMVVNLFDIAEFYMEIFRKLRFDVVILRLSSLGVTIYDIQGGSKEGIRTIKQGILVPKCLFCLLFFDLCEVYGWVSI